MAQQHVKHLRDKLLTAIALAAAARRKLDDAIADEDEALQKLIRAKKQDLEYFENQVGAEEPSYGFHEDIIESSDGEVEGA